MDLLERRWKGASCFLKSVIAEEVGVSMDKLPDYIFEEENVNAAFYVDPFYYRLFGEYALFTDPVIRVARNLATKYLHTKN